MRRVVCACDVKRTKDGWITLGGACDTNACKDEYWSAASAEPLSEATSVLMKAMNPRDAPVRRSWCRAAKRSPVRSCPDIARGRSAGLQAPILEGSRQPPAMKVSAWRPAQVLHNRQKASASLHPQRAAPGTRIGAGAAGVPSQPPGMEKIVMSSTGIVKRAAACAALVGLATGMAHAADMPMPPMPDGSAVQASPASDWKYQVTLYGWATSLSGDLGVRNLPTTAIDVPFSEVLKHLDGALMGSVFADNGTWLLLGDVVFAKLSASRPLGAFGGDLGAGVTELIAMGAVGYMLPTGRPDLDFAVTGGLRYTSVKGSLSWRGPGPLLDISASARQEWLDPTVGFFAHWALNETWFVNAIADIGGFGVGSDLSSTGYLGVGYMWTRSFSTSLGYRYLYEDYEAPGATTGRFRYDTMMHGPTFAMAWRF